VNICYKNKNNHLIYSWCFFIKPASKTNEIEKKRKRNSLASISPVKQISEKSAKKKNAKNTSSDGEGHGENHNSNSNNNDNTDESRNFTKIDRFQPLMLLEFSSSSEMVVVERPLLKIMEALPEGFFRDRYGT
jgi:hypothetical protein